jgi:hypothetical protein
MTKKTQNILWFIFVMGILLFGIAMIVWTVTKSVSAPVHESNNFMLKYQTADMTINEIVELQRAFDEKYTIQLKNVQEVELPVKYQNVHAKRSLQKPIGLNNGENSFSYEITTKDGVIIQDAQVDFLLTRPHIRTDDTLENNVSFTNNLYTTKPLNIDKEGRYTLLLKVTIDKLVGHLETAAYLQK